MNEQNAFLDLLLAAMKDAALTLNLTQMKAQINPDGKGLRHVRIIVVPEAMEYGHVDGRPIGQNQGNN